MATAFILGSGLANYIDAFQTDFADPTDITESQIRDLFVKAIRRVNRRIGGTFAYYAATSGISPTPTETQGDIILLQAECLFAKRRYSSAVSKGISVKDADTAIDTTSAFAGYREVQKSICDDLNDAIREYMLITAGAEVYGEVVWYANQNVIEEIDHNGDAYNERDWTSPFDD